MTSTTVQTQAQLKYMFLDGQKYEKLIDIATIQNKAFDLEVKRKATDRRINILQEELKFVKEAGKYLLSPSSTILSEQSTKEKKAIKKLFYQRLVERINQ